MRPMTTALLVGCKIGYAFVSRRTPVRVGPKVRPPVSVLRIVARRCTASVQAISDGLPSPADTGARAAAKDKGWETL